MTGSVDKSAIICGVGPALGESLVSTCLAQSYQTLALSRSARPVPPEPTSSGTLHSPQEPDNVPGAAVSAADCVRKAADAADFGSLESAITGFLDTAPPLSLAIYNAARFLKKPFADTGPEEFQACWQVNVLGAVHFARLTIPAMLETGGGTLLFSGATASLRGGADFAAFASSKFALRGLAQSLARSYQAQDIHIAHIVLDGAIAGSEASAPYRQSETDCLQSDDIARQYLQLAHQPKSAWTHELDLRPMKENF